MLISSTHLPGSTLGLEQIECYNKQQRATGFKVSLAVSISDQSCQLPHPVDAWSMHLALPGDCPGHRPHLRGQVDWAKPGKSTQESSEYPEQSCLSSQGPTVVKPTKNSVLG